METNGPVASNSRAISAWCTIAPSDPPGHPLGVPRHLPADPPGHPLGVPRHLPADPPGHPLAVLLASWRSWLGSRPGGPQQLPYLLVGGLRERPVGVADGPERPRGGGADDLVGLAPELLAGRRRRGRHRDLHPGAEHGPGHGAVSGARRPRRSAPGAPGPARPPRAPRRRWWAPAAGRDPAPASAAPGRRPLARHPRSCVASSLSSACARSVLSPSYHPRPGVIP